MQVLRLMIVAILFGVTHANAAGEQAPRIEGKGKAAKLVMPDVVKAAIEQVAPGFRPWQLKDYIVWVREDFEKPDSTTLPFAVVADINNDGINDLVVDGRTQSDNLMVAVLSSPHGYTARIVDTYPQSDPHDFTAYDENKKPYTGFNSWLEFNPETKQKDKSYAFTRLYMQVLDADGEPMNDGGVVVWHFRKGEFEMESPGEGY